MNSQSSGRNQKPKGFKVKPAFQIALLLAVCFWLLYQMKHSHSKEYSGEHGFDIFGRKENVGSSKGANLLGESMKKEDGGGGDDVLDGNAEQKNEEESIHKVNDSAHGNLGSHEGNEIQKETEKRYKELNKTEDHSDIEVRGNDKPVGLRENSLQEGNSRGEHEDTQTITLDQDGEKDVKNMSRNEVGMGKEQKSHGNHDDHENVKDREKEPQRLEESSTNKDISIRQSESKGDSFHSPNSVVDGVVHGFDDENGVPLDGNDIIESTVTGSGDRAIIPHQDTNSSSSNQIDTNENTVNEEVASKEGTNGAYLEAKSKASVEDSKINIKPKVETSSGIGVHADTSAIISVSETTQGGSSVLDS